MPVGIRSHRQRDHDGQARESVREMKQEPQRRLVGPLGVVDGEQQRSAFGEVDHQPIQPVQGGERDITGLLGRSDVGEDRFGQPRRARQQPIAFGAVSTGHRAFQQLANDPEAESALQLSAARGQYGHFCRGWRVGAAPPAAPFSRCLQDPRSAAPRRRLRSLRSAQRRARLRSSTRSNSSRCSPEEKTSADSSGINSVAAPPFVRPSFT